MAAPNAETRLLNLTELRTALESNVSELAEKSGLTRQTISKIEADEPVRLTTINTVFQAIRDLYGHRFEKLNLEAQSENTYIIDFALQTNRPDDHKDEFSWENWDRNMEQASWLIAKASEKRELDQAKLFRDIDTLGSIARKMLEAH